MSIIKRLNAKYGRLEKNVKADDLLVLRMLQSLVPHAEESSNDQDDSWMFEDHSTDSTSEDK